MKEDVFKNYVRDLVFILAEKARDAKSDKELSLDKSEKDYKLGYLMALHDVISLIKEQADAFEIDQEIIGVKDIEPDSDLL